jgi:SpoVK/Ycf46/Vps4 family AAA+-type ATPase
MASAEQIHTLVSSFAERDDERFRVVALEIAVAAAKAGDSKLADSLRTLVDRSRRTALPTIGPRAVPITRPEGEFSALMAVSYPKVRLVDMVLPDSVRASLARVLIENRAGDRLRERHLDPRRRLLIAGPPGCGKTMSAKALAGESGLPLMVVQFHALITKFMGETAAKLHGIFQAMHTTRGVYLFDEFDVLATSRGEQNDVGEARRIVNSFLQLVEQDDSESIIVAATNRPEALDSAIFRRFDDLIEFTRPDAKMVRMLVENRLAALAPLRLDWKSLGTAVKGLSHGEIVKACEDAAKAVVLGQATAVSTALLTKALRSRRNLGITKHQK